MAANEAGGLHRLALLDFQAALAATDVDVLFHAYRAVEAIRQASAPEEAKVADQWSLLHERLDTDAETVKKLAAASKDVRHGTAEHEIALAEHRQEMVEIARDVLTREFSKLLDRDLALLDPVLGET